MKVLIVDDSSLDRSIIKKALGTRGVEVVEASSPPAAMELLDTDTDIDAALVDMLMPYAVKEGEEPLNGRDVVRKARLSGVQVVAITSMLFLVPQGTPSVEKGENDFNRSVREMLGLPEQTPANGVEVVAR